MRISFYTSGEKFGCPPSGSSDVLYHMF